MEHILIVDDSKTICNTLAKKIKEELGYNPIIAHTKKECADKLLEYRGKISVALLDLGLPDALNGEVVDFVTKFKIPSVVLTASDDKEELFRDKDIVDYVIKDSSFAFDFIINLVKRIVTNKNIKILVVDDSKSVAFMIMDLLHRYQIKTLYAKNGLEALEVLEENTDIKLIYTDYNMPEMNGLELIKTIRKHHSKDEISITTITSNKDTKIVSKFLKYGSNDFLYKGFSTEEFYARLNSSLETLELFEDIKNKANKDFLTGAYNRRYFFTKGQKEFDSHDNVKLFMIDIDKFKNINDTYGHDIGDVAIQEVISIVNKNLEGIDSLVARFGGEEFCGLIYEQSDKDFINILENIRKSFESNIIKTSVGNISYTVSIGYVLEKLKSIDKMVIASDKGLYKAKESGRNQVRN